MLRQSKLNFLLENRNPTSVSSEEHRLGSWRQPSTTSQCLLHLPSSRLRDTGNLPRWEPNGNVCTFLDTSCFNLLKPKFALQGYLFTMSRIVPQDLIRTSRGHSPRMSEIREWNRVEYSITLSKHFLRPFATLGTSLEHRILPGVVSCLHFFRLFLNKCRNICYGSIEI